MIVSEGIRLSDLSQGAPPAIYPDKPSELPGLSYRVSAYVYNTEGIIIPDIMVNIADVTGKKLISRKKTDGQGKVYFDLPSDLQVTVYPVPKEGDTASPSAMIVAPVPISKIFGNAWDWKGDSVSFVISRNLEEPGEEPGKEPGKGELFTLSNILMAGGVILGGYVLYQWLSSGGTE